MGRLVIAVHLGAGRYGKRLREHMDDLLRSCIQSGVDAYSQTKDSVDTVSSVMTVLEASGLVNTGNGSALTRGHTVECDGIVIRSGDHALGCVIAVPECANPTRIATALLKESTLSLEYGEILRSCILVGSAAASFASDRSLLHKTEVSSVQKERGLRYSAILERRKQCEKRERVSLSTERDASFSTERDASLPTKRVVSFSTEQDASVTDTVGCIIVTDDEIVVAGSSGGSWMRVSGRGGLCSVPGAGVWCDETVGVVCSGYGECFIRTLFAREMCEAVRENREAHVTEGLRRLEKDQQRMRISLPSCFGLLCCCREENRVRVILSHTSKMMGMGVFDGERIETRLSEQTGEECVYYE
ncbi:hypothetical protein WA556_003149, partial [Blastocystis sp. ATCC 50177/Nand II]